MWITFDRTTIHECPWISFICITDDILLRALIIKSKFPFQACRESTATAAPESRHQHIVDNLLLAASLMLGGWPGFLTAPEGYDIVVPGGISYRFH